MKNFKTFILVFSVLVSTNCLAQFNLQFNQVKRVKFSLFSIDPIPQIAGTIVVPANKVWKIESGSLSLGGVPPAWTSTLTIDDQIIQSTYIIVNQQSSISSQTVNSPIWLPSGTYNVGYYCAVASVSVSIAISAIEYNLIP